MSRRNQSIFGSIDWISFSLYLSLISIGWLMIYTVGLGEGYPASRIDFLFETTVGKQSFFILAALAILFFILVIEWKFWRTFAFPIYAFFIGGLVLVLIFGNTIKGATSWFSIPGGFTLQPSEFAKFGTCLALAAYLSTFSTNIDRIKHQLIAFGIVLLPISLIFLQPDAGSALVFLSFFVVLFREGMPAFPYLIGLILFSLFISTLTLTASISVLIYFSLLTFFMISNLRKVNLYHFLAFAALIGVTIAATQYGYSTYALLVNGVVLIGLAIYHWLNRQTRLGIGASIGAIIGGGFAYFVAFAFENILKPHQQDRLNVWLNPEKCDPQGSLYNVLQSKLAIGSGGLYGKGFLEGTLTKLNYVPEQSTDFIFCTIGEEQGAIGSVAIISLFIIFILRIIALAERQKSEFSRAYMYGVAGLLFLHVFVNIGMTMGIVPIIGIPLPFISYGGSSLLGFSIMFAVVLKLDSNRYAV